MYFKTYTTLSAISLLLLLTGTAFCKPIEVLSSGEPATEQPSRCRQAKPRTPSTFDCPDRNRRFIYQESNVKGCKPFGICPSDTDATDAKYTGGAENYFLDFDSCQMECMTHIQCPQLDLSETNNNARVSSTNGLSGWGEKIVYECNAGYSFARSEVKYTRLCQKNGNWSGGEPVCLKQCQSPAAVSNGNFSPAKELYNHGGNVHYTCNVGYKLEGDAMTTCGSNGQWMGPEPICTCAFPLVNGKCPPLCPEPRLIDNGDINAPVGARGHGGTSHYSCREGYTLIGNSSRTCYNGSWLGNEPTCWKVMVSMTISNITRDVTNSSVTLTKGSTGIAFEVIPTPKDLFKDDEIRWEFMGTNQRTAIPAGLMVEKLKITFNTILNTEEQEGNYTISFGDHSTSFKLEVEDATVVATTFPYFLTVNPNPDTVVSHGSPTSLRCISKGKPVPSIQWYHNNEPIMKADGSKYTIMTSTSSNVIFNGLQISSIEDSDLGEYRCSATNSAGTNTTIVSRLVFSSRKRRSVELQPSQTDSLCHQKSANTVTILGRVKTTISGQIPTYRVHIRHIFGSPSSKLSQMLHKTKTLSTVVWSSSLLDYREGKLQANADYVFQGQLLSGQVLLTSPTSTHRYTPAVRQQLAAC